jgi:chromosome segregation ATPase
MKQANAKITEMQSELAALRKDNTALLADKATVQTECERLLEEQDKKAKDTAQIIEDLKEKLDTAKSERGRLEAHDVSQQKQHRDAAEKLRAELARVSLELDSVRADNASLLEEQSTMLDLQKDLDEQHASDLQKIADLEARLGVTNRQTLDTAAELLTLRIDFNEQQARAKQYDADKVNLLTKLAEEESARRKLEADLQESKASVEKLRAELVQFKSEAETKESEISERVTCRLANKRTN